MTSPPPAEACVPHWRIALPTPPPADLLLLLALCATAWLLLLAAFQPIRAASFTMDEPDLWLPLANFHEVERFADGSKFRWTRASSSLELPNPGGERVLSLRMAGAAGRTVPTRIAIDGWQTDLLVQPDLRQYRLLVPASNTYRSNVTITAETFEERRRTLGVVLTDVGIAGGGGGAPTLLVLILMIASGCRYVLLRQAGTPRPRAALVTLGVQALVALWLVLGGWRYALVVPVLLAIAALSLGAILWDAGIKHWFHALPDPTPPATRPLWVRESWLLAGVLLLAVALRLPWLAAPDPVGDLELAARRMGFLFYNGLDGAYTGGGDYMPLRLYLLAALSQLVPLFNAIPTGFYAPLPVATMTLIKLPALLADLVTITIIYIWSLRWLHYRHAAALAALYAMLPPVWINVTWWGQVDALLLLPMLAAVLLLERNGGLWSWLCWVLALLLKPQAIVLLPLMYAATLRLHGSRGLVRGGVLAIAMFVVVSLPVILAGQGPGLLQAYLGSVGRFPKLTAGAYNLWYLATGGASGADVGQGVFGISFRLIGLLLVAGAASIVGLVLLRRSDRVIRVQAAAVLLLAFFALPTQIHERYLFFPLAFLALRAASNPYMVLPLGVLAASLTLNIFGDLDGFIPPLAPLISGSPLPLVLAVLNLAILLGLLLHLLVLVRR